MYSLTMRITPASMCQEPRLQMLRVHICKASYNVKRNIKFMVWCNKEIILLVSETKLTMYYILGLYSTYSVRKWWMLNVCSTKHLFNHYKFLIWSQRDDDLNSSTLRDSFSTWSVNLSMIWKVIYRRHNRVYHISSIYVHTLVYQAQLKITSTSSFDPSWHTFSLVQQWI